MLSLDYGTEINPICTGAVVGIDSSFLGLSDGWPVYAWGSIADDFWVNNPAYAEWGRGETEHWARKSHPFNLARLICDWVAFHPVGIPYSPPLITSSTRAHGPII